MVCDSLHVKAVVPRSYLVEAANVLLTRINRLIPLAGMGPQDRVGALA